jgi:hypothetical protein
VNRHRVAAAVLLMVGIGSTIAVNYQRERALAGPREVGIVLDHAATLMVAGQLGFETRSFMEELVAERVTALGISEVSMADLPYRPGVTVYRGHELIRPGGRPGDHLGMAHRVLRGEGLFEPWYTYILVGDPAFAAFLAQGAERRLGPERVRMLEIWGGTHAIVLRGVPTRPRPDPRRPERDLREPDLRFGFWPGDVALARELDLIPVAVLAEDPRLGSEDLEHLLGPVVRLGVDLVFLAGDSTWGYGDSERLAAAARAHREWRLHPASLAPGEQPGFAALAEAADYRGLRFGKHRGGDPPAAVASTVRDRPQAVYFSPAQFPGPAEATREGNRRTLRQLVAAISGQGYRPGPPRALAPYRLSPGLAALLGMAVAAGVLGAVGAGAGWLGRKRPGLPWWVVGGIVTAALGFAWPGAGREVLAFLAAVSFPIWIVLEVLAAASREGRGRAGIGHAALLAVAGTAGTTAAGFLVRALLADTAYALGVRSFPAAVVAAVLTSLLVLAVTAAGTGWSADRRGLSFGDLLLGAGGLAAGALLVLAWSAPLRPVEFLAGHPALVMGLALPELSPRRRMAIALLAATGQASVIHHLIDFRAPAAGVLGQTAGGLALGLALGLAGVTAWRHYRVRGAVP